MKLSAIGTFDTLNPFVIKGVPAAGIGQIFDTLMTSPRGRAGERIRAGRRKRPISRRTGLSVLYTLRKEARFHDGSPMTPDDVDVDLRDPARQGSAALSLLLRRCDQGRKGGRARRPLLSSNRPTTANCRRSSGEMPVLSKAYWSSRDFEKTTLDPPLGSGPYKIEVARPRPLDHLSPRRRLLGRGSAGQQGPLSTSM